MKILITGGNGFAGRYISKYFCNLGHEVTATYRNTKPEDFPQIKYVNCELSENLDIKGEFDAIIHTACSHSGRILPMQEYIRDNVDSARQIIKYARNTGIKIIFYFSTRSVYGNIEQFEVDETTDIINPDGYGMTKYIAEQLFSDIKDINTLGFRLPGIVGPGAHDIWLVDIVDRIINGEDIQVSDFDTYNLVHIGDISRFIEKMLKFSINGGSFKYPVVNLACTESVNNLDIVKMCKKRLKSPSKIIEKKPIIASPGVKGGLFILKCNRAVEMGFEPSSPQDIINLYLDSVI